MRDPADVWRAWAEVWPARRAERTGAPDDAILSFARTHLPVGARVLDAGCGDGTYAAALHARGLDVQGVDLSEALLVQARARFPEVPFVRAALEALPFPDGAFGGALCLTALEWVAGPLAALRELARVTRGPVVLGVLGAGNRTRALHLARLYAEASPMNGLTPFEVAWLLEREGWTVTAEAGVTREGPCPPGRASMAEAMVYLWAAWPPGHPATP
ncbi:class I SAM-dependent methyltransferase [Deinococcus maricopensis]|uniref:Methyltransferase type 11 n=1 Tax=Deinococcus maricopensis (strain DSM 21211 / LMG 22137 / NRRL B-23946 / LB-34) TaxID=709986 RepID=E8UAJ0_DEIML|nr:class I SAM-dependent methyltransferase [Deinococcus maricopensis]ADV68079.1 Methyltransferase type 11 [Deinococcus maricopensis DSM 21211]